ncbi:peptidylprolyl isomerase [Polaribacter sp. PL03]|uniref:peptidylprolyl isomerase n=1 Tax=Polaribacter sp. PL03 TaxID=3088353 RepID=UPI0029CE3274|nr:peptidylprolyl isomerase [Polaribacter sp. PL03]MDX6746479.1 peptidylprolyl isomerase [Polaribacter sp. PL03]
MKNKFVLLLSIVLFTSCATKKFKEKWLEKEAPLTFKARFETTQGNFDIEAKREWSPEGVDRLYQLIKYEYYNDVAIFRVVPNFVAQFGIHNDSLINKSWSNKGLEDEPVVIENDSMTISFARGGKRTRTNQIFINLKKNDRLNTLEYSGVKGFPVVAKVISGKENVLKFYDGYGDKLGRQQGKINRLGNAFLRENYPKVDYIIKAYFIK